MRRDPEQTRAALVEAALETLKDEGFAGTTARAIAGRAGVNQALVFYHFGGVTPLLLAALDHSAAVRLERYREAVAAAGSLEELVPRIRALWDEDVAGGHVTIVTELIGASLAHPELRPELVARMRPWLELGRGVFEEALRASPLEEVVPGREAAFAVTAMYLGLNLLSRLDPASEELDALFSLLERVAPAFA